MNAPATALVAPFERSVETCYGIGHRANLRGEDQTGFNILLATRPGKRNRASEDSRDGLSPSPYPR